MMLAGELAVRGLNDVAGGVGGHFELFVGVEVRKSLVRRRLRFEVCQESCKPVSDPDEELSRLELTQGSQDRGSFVHPNNALFL